MSGTDVSGNRPATDVRTSSRMSRQARRDTAPEMLLRRELHRRGLRYRVECPLPGWPRRRADLVFLRARIVVLVDGCFWHVCPTHGTAPLANCEWWADKRRRNVERDKETDAYLQAIGWRLVRVWEHESPDAAADRVQDMLMDRVRSSVD